MASHASNTVKPSDRRTGPDAPSQTPLAKARRRRTIAAKRIVRAQARVGQARARVDDARAEFSAASKDLKAMEALVAQGVRGLN